MSAEYAPGTVAVATVRGLPNVRVIRGEGHWALAVDTDDYITDSANERAGATYITDVRPLIVLDLEHFDPIEAVRHLDDATNGQLPTPGHHDERRPVVFHIAQQIREQTKPSKPAEPGMYGVVEASCCHNALRMEWVRGQHGWNAIDTRRSEPDAWEDLVDPVLVREGVGS